MEHMAEEACLPHVGQEALRDRRALESPAGTHLIPDFFPLGPAFQRFHHLRKCPVLGAQPSTVAFGDITDPHYDRGIEQQVATRMPLMGH